MDWLDLGIVLFMLVALVRGSEVGFVRQFFSTAGIFAGLFLGAWVGIKASHLGHTPDSRALITLLTTLAFTLLLMTAGEYLGWAVKFRLSQTKLTDILDRVGGSALALITILVAVWLGSSIYRSLPDGMWARQIRGSRIVSALDSRLPSAPGVLTSLGHLIEPNGFPQVFNGLEPVPQKNAKIPDIGSLTPAVRADAPSIVKVEGSGCGGVVEGSGFVAGTNLVITNAHVVAGVQKPFVLDSNGVHHVSVVLFDPNLDIAILRTTSLAGAPLRLNTDNAPGGTAAAIVGYPAGGDFTAGSAVVLQSFTAIGRNIYNQGSTQREVYSLKGDVEQGNSGGPLVAADGSVIGVIFAKSTSYDQVGYALTMQHVADELAAAKTRSVPVSTGTCAE
ncbi:MAG TPA: MarP family serine protease [Patescibacteria group bacterium]|nr:MarP family serine protease [Patescibacteria group bacterium]